MALESELPRELVPENVSVYYTGVGKVNAAIKATQVILGFLMGNWKAEDAIVLNYGSAGSNTIPKGTLADCRYFIQNDMNTPFGKSHETPFDELIYPELKEPTIEFGTGYVCRTQDKFEDNPQGVFDMEAYSIAKACIRNKIEFRCFKYITDQADNQAPDSWKESVSSGEKFFISKLLELGVTV